MDLECLWENEWPSSDGRFKDDVLGEQMDKPHSVNTSVLLSESLAKQGTASCTQRFLETTSSGMRSLDGTHEDSSRKIQRQRARLERIPGGNRLEIVGTDERR